MGSQTDPTDWTERTKDESTVLPKVVSAIDSIKQTMVSSLFRLDADGMFAVGLLGLSVVQIGSLATDLVVSLSMLLPLQSTGELGDSLCDAGVGTLITLFLFVLAILLVYKSIPDIYRGFDAKGSRSSGAQKQKDQHFNNAAMKIIGAVVIASLPTFLSTVGFTLLSCVDSVQIFG